MTFWEHVEELRKMLLRMGLIIALATVGAFCFHQSLFSLILAPLNNQTLYLFSPLEGFTTALKVSFWTALLATAPIWTFLFLHFIAPALRMREKKIFLPFFGLSILFIGCGILFAYTVTLPVVMHFFHTFNKGIGDNLWGVGQTVHIVLLLILAHGLVFELYVGLLFLIHFNIVTASHLQRGRRAMIVLIFILAAILTPPDLLSQLLLGIPMLFLYETALLYAHAKRRKYFHKQT